MVLLLFAAHLQAQEVPAEPAPETTDTQPAEEFVVHDMLIMLSDNFVTTFNAQSMFTSTLPGFARLSPRPRAELADRDRPMPLGVIAISGKPPQQIDVLLEINEGRPLYAWPPVAVKKDNRLLWTALAIGNDPASLPQPRVPDHWIETLRGQDIPTFTTRRNSEQALLYDVELNAGNALKIEAADAGYKVTREGDLPIVEVTLFKLVGEGAFRTVSYPAPPKSTDNVPAPEALADLTHATLDEAAQVLHAPLTEAGLTPQQVSLAMATVRRVVHDQGDQMVAVYRLDSAWMDQRLPLEVTPAPGKKVRVPLVILINADPALVGRIDGLISDLGHQSWAKREAAHQTLASLGKIAEPRLTKHRAHTDAEVAFRVEALLELLEAAPVDKDG